LGGLENELNLYYRHLLICDFTTLIQDNIRCIEHEKRYRRVAHTLSLNDPFHTSLPTVFTMPPRIISDERRNT